MEDVCAEEKQEERCSNQEQLLRAHTCTRNMEHLRNGRHETFGAALEREENRSIKNHRECNGCDKGQEAVQPIEGIHEDLEGECCKQNARQYSSQDTQRQRKVQPLMEKPCGISSQQHSLSQRQIEDAEKAIHKREPSGDQCTERARDSGIDEELHYSAESISSVSIFPSLNVFNA